MSTERTNWRDERLSKWHQNIGADCPAVDLDFLLVEYDRGEAMALVEYKHHRCRRPTFQEPSYAALRDLCAGAEIPLICCIYSDDLTTWDAYPLNIHAELWLNGPTQLTENQWIDLLYRIRGRITPPQFLIQLETKIKSVIQ
ncbi:MAG: hypothetical protein DMF62_03050 [Acidobacteria bacterium]|nr:MAG: hypothetical protein DMF62_03050 [Acidobacteriota bacterium]